MSASSQHPLESRKYQKPARRKQRRILAAIETLELRAYLAVNPISFEFGTTSQITYLPGSTMQLVSLGGDNIPDLVDVVKPTGTGSAQVKVQLGNGDGTFKNAVSLASNGSSSSGGQIVSMAIADVNGDGAPDIVLAVCPAAVGGKYYQGTVDVFLNNGNGTFAAQRTYSNVGYGTSAVAVGDFNGRPDIVVGNSYDKSLRLLLGTGNGRFTLQQKLALSGNFSSIVAADVNGDGNMDIVATDASGAAAKVFILPGNGDGTFGLQTTIPEPNVSAVTVADITGDGKPDILTNYGGTTFLKNMTPTGGAFAFAAPVTSAGVAFGKLAQPKTNGAFEMLSANASLNTVSLAIANANGTFKTTYSFDTVATGLKGTTTFTAGYGPIGVGIGDETRDGRPDLVALCASGTVGSITVLTGLAAGGFAAPQLQSTGVVSTGNYPNAVAIADVNGDGKGDIVSTYYGSGGAGGVAIFLNNTQGDFGPAKQIITDANGPTGVVVADFNGDGKMDLAVANRDNGTVSVFFGNGDGTFGAAHSYTVGADPQSIAVGDFNGHNDIVVANTGILPGTPGTTVTVLLGSGTGTFTTSALTVGNGPSSVVVGDFNKDGKPDIAVADQMDGEVTLLLATGSGTFAAGTTIGASFLYGPTALAAADFDGDGNLDLVALNSKNDTLTQLKGNGNGTFSVQTIYNLNLPPTPTQSNAVGLAVGLINSDTSPDVVLTYQGGTTAKRQIAAVMLNQNDGSGGLQAPVTVQVTNALGAGATPVTPVPVAVAVGDLNGDNKPDLVTLDSGGTSPGGVSIVFNNSPVLPSFTSAARATFTVGVAGTFTIMSTGTPTSAITEFGSLPAGVTFVDNGNGTATLAGTPAVGTGGQYVLFLVADNGVGGTTNQEFVLSVREAPQITSANNVSFTSGQSSVFLVATTGFPAPTISETGALPTGVSLSDNFNGTATLGGSPQNAAGTFTITITAANGVAPNATQVFTITFNEAPTITSGNTVTFSAGQANSFMVTATGFPAPGFIETGRLPAGVSFFDNGNGTATLSGDPLLTTKGTYNLTLTAFNGVTALGGASVINQSFTLIVVSPVAPAFVGVKTATITATVPGLVNIDTTGFPVPTLTRSGALPTGVTFTDNTDGTATLFGTPAAGTGGTYKLTLSANNGVGRTVTEVYTLIVDEAPKITSINHATFTTGAPNSFTVTATGVPEPTMAPLTTIGGLPPGVSFVDHPLTGTATISGRPAATAGGTYEIFIVANNGVTPTEGQLFTLTVNQPPAITSANHATFTTGTGGSFAVTTTGFPFNVLTETGALPTGLKFQDNGDDTGTLVGTPGAGTGGIYHFTLHAGNGIGTAVSQVFTLTVNQGLVFTSAGQAPFTVGAAGAFAITASGFPAGTVSEVGALPAGLTFKNNGNNSATISGTPHNGAGGNYLLTLNATNSLGSVAQELLTLQVKQAPAITSANHATFSAANGGAFLITTTGFPLAVLTETPALPAGLVFTDNGDGSGTLAGKPAAGIYMLTLTATNSVAVFNQVFTLVVS